MCGIVGVVHGRGNPVDPRVLAQMTQTLSHRGPDGDGFWIDGPVGLGHRRLAIIDPRLGQQPISNEDGSIRLSYNGELYGEPILRAKLESRGHRYRTLCDSETIVHLYEEEGHSFVQSLNGMFAIALWDAQEKRLLLTRDRMGQKPLYYARLSAGGIAFGSEPKALLTHPEIGRTLNHDALASYLFYEYLPAPQSIWEPIVKLGAGEILTWEAGEIQVERYWDPKPPIPESEAPSIEKASAEFWELLRASVARHRRSDVPLGLFLSGGIDSSSVAAALAELEPPQSIRTFSIGFDDPSFDESQHALRVAQTLGTSHQSKTFAVADLVELLPEVAGWLDEPFGDASVLPTHLLSRFAREEVKVVLGGDGADELLAGYPTFGIERAASRYKDLPKPLRSMIAAMVRQLPVDHRNFSFDFKLKQFLRGASAPIPLAHQRWLGSFSGREIKEILVEPPSIDIEEAHLARAAGLMPEADPLTRSLQLYQALYLPDDILTKVDRASMAVGLEVRAPFLDARLVDFIHRMPSSHKLYRGESKRLLKRAIASRLPASIRSRAKKGFGIPVARWLRGPLAPLVDRLLHRDRIQMQGLFREATVERLVGEHRAGVRNHRKPLWTLLMFQLWYDHWLCGRAN